MKAALVSIIDIVDDLDRKTRIWSKQEVGRPQSQ
jgi:hypothetical protein